jgi:hypothetical protein
MTWRPALTGSSKKDVDTKRSGNTRTGPPKKVAGTKGSGNGGKGQTKKVVSKKSGGGNKHKGGRQCW